jgi:hypothetical protein
MSSGAGSWPGGIGPAGVDPIQTGYSARALKPRAIRYEAKVRDWELDPATGGYRRVTPAEQGVALSLMVAQGSITASPATGHTLNEILYLGGADVEADATDRMKRANPLARLVADGQVEIKRVAVDTSGTQLRVALYFVDLTGDKNKTLRRDASIGT